MFWKPLNDTMNKIGTRILSAMTFDYKKSPIIKRTKQFIGLLVSMIVLTLAIFLVIGVTYTIIAATDGVIYLFANFGMYILGAALALVALAISVAIGYIIFNWIQYVIGKYQMGKRVWYVQGFLYSIGYPVKYLILGIFYLLYYILFVPFKFIFYTFLWKVILVNLGIFFWGQCRAIGGIFVGSLGIFGEYFGASKKDYCPGIEWTDTED